MKSGTKIIVIADSCSHCYEIGTELTIKGYYNGRGNSFTVNEGSNYININDFKVKPMTEESILNDILNEEEVIKVANCNIIRLKEKLDYIKTSNKEFDETEFHVFLTLKIINNPDYSITEKTRLISNIITNG